MSIRTIRPGTIDLDDEFLGADDPRGLVSIDDATHTDMVRPNIDRAPLDELVERILREYGRYDTAMDSAMAIELHRNMPLTRREASDMGVWGWLGIACYPHLVAWRWKPSGDPRTRPKNRFIGSSVRQTFSRLWWAAELTVEGSDYGLTQKLFALPTFQDVNEAIFGRAFCQHRPAIEAFIHEMDGQSEGVVRQLAREFSHLLTMRPLEYFDAIEVREMLSGLKERVAA